MIDTQKYFNQALHIVLEAGEVSLYGLFRCIHNLHYLYNKNKMIVINWIFLRSCQKVLKAQKKYQQKQMIKIW